MALDKIKQEIEGKTRKEIEEKNEAIRIENLNKIEWQKTRRDAERKISDNLLFINSLEDFFWECTNDFSRITKLSIKSTNRSRLRFFGVSSATIRSPYLKANFSTPIKYNAWKHENYIELIISGDDFKFHSCCSHTSSYGMGRATSRSVTTTHAQISGTLKIEPFKFEIAKQWIESLFEQYYRKLQPLL